MAEIEFQKVSEVIKTEAIGEEKGFYNCFLYFNDLEIKAAYEEFQTSVTASLTSMFITILVPTSIQLLYAFFAMMANDGDIFKLLFLLLVTTSVCGWAVLFYRKKRSEDSKVQFPLNMKTMENLFVLGMSIYTGLRLIIRTAEGGCESENYFHSFSCNPSHGVGGIPQDTLFGICVLPMIFTAVFRSASWSCILTSWIICMGSMIASSWLHSGDSGFIWALMTAYFPCSMIVIFETRRQNLFIFVMNQKLKDLLDENEKMAEAIRKDELRSMIGNVAHDLKTPLAAFINGAEYVTKLLDTLKDDIHDNKATLETLVVEGIQSIESVMKNMKNINSFMIMTINRCIDYTKASKGIVLVAKHSSFPLAEALELPHNCMKDMQESQTKIERAVISKDICSHVITDKQWLQENVLCLLSNASKYSSHGVVTVTVSLSTINDILEPCNSPRPFDKSIDQESNGDKDNRLILIEVEDNGIGIAPEIRGKLFNPFKQAQRLAGGTGLGLYSLAKRVEALNGYYGVNDRKDGEQGSLIWFAIPYRPDPMTARALLNSNVFSNGTLRTINSKPMHVLIVDDAVSITKMCGKMLKQLGHFVDTAENGAVAVDRVTEKWKCFYNPSSSTPREEDITHPFYDLILMDLQMPIMDGLEATRRIRKFQTDRETDTSCCHANSYSPRSLKSSLKSNTNISRPVFVCTTKIIGLSANSDHETTRLAYLAGVDAFIPKPFTIQAVDEVMQKWSGV